MKNVQDPSLDTKQSGYDMCSFCCPLNQVKKLKKKSDLEGARQASQNAAKLGMPNRRQKRDVETRSARWKGGMVQHLYDKGWKVSWWMVMQFLGGEGDWDTFQWYLIYTLKFIYSIYCIYCIHFGVIEIQASKKGYLSNQSQLYDYRIICLIFSISERFFLFQMCIIACFFWDKASHYGPSAIPNQMSNESKNPGCLGLLYYPVL